jgi:hypothetical protein
MRHYGFTTTMTSRGDSKTESKSPATPRLDASYSSSAQAAIPTMSDIMHLTDDDENQNSQSRYARLNRELALQWSKIPLQQKLYMAQLVVQMFVVWNGMQRITNDDEAHNRVHGAVASALLEDEGVGIHRKTSQLCRYHKKTGIQFFGNASRLSKVSERPEDEILFLSHAELEIGSKKWLEPWRHAFRASSESLVDLFTGGGVRNVLLLDEYETNKKEYIHLRLHNLDEIKIRAENKDEWENHILTNRIHFRCTKRAGLLIADLGNNLTEAMDIAIVIGLDTKTTYTDDTIRVAFVKRLLLYAKGVIERKGKKPRLIRRELVNWLAVHEAQNPVFMIVMHTTASEAPTSLVS